MEYIKHNNRKGKNNYIILFFMCFLCLFITSCATTSSNNSPSWVSNPTKDYPSSQYLTAVGYGSDRGTAENSAIASLSKQIRQSVQADTTDNEKIVQTASGWNETRNFDTKIQTSTDIIISGISIEEVWEVKQNKELVFYALAIMNRDDAGVYYKSKAQSNSDVINSQIIEAYSKQGTFYSLATLEKAAILAIENDYYLDVLAVVNPDMRRISSPDSKTGAAVIELARRAHTSIVVGVDITVM